MLEQATAFADELVALRRDLHRHPELSFCEHRTAATVAALLTELGWRVRTGIGKTGVIADLGEAGPRVALRADMDALPIQEASQVEYASTVPGVMHACGHDAHVAMLVGAARLLTHQARSGQLPGRVRLLFQPSEEAADAENKSGAIRMIEDGALQDVAAIFGLHIGAHLPAGRAYVRGGPYMAGSDTFIATVQGRSAHAARPHEGIDAVVLAAHVVLACQNGVARRLKPGHSGVLTIGKIEGGVAENVIADAVKLHGTIRYFEQPVRNTLRHALDDALNVAGALGGGALLEMNEGYPPVVNDVAMSELAAAAVEQVGGAEALAEYDPLMAAEDFAYYLEKVPGSFFWLGAALEPAREHHHPNFDIDERVLPLGAAILANCALAALVRTR